MIISAGNVSTCVYFIQRLECKLRGGAALKWAGGFIGGVIEQEMERGSLRSKCIIPTCNFKISKDLSKEKVVKKNKKIVARHGGTLLL